MSHFTHAPNPLLEQQRRQLEKNLRLPDRRGDRPTPLNHVWQRSLTAIVNFLTTTHEPHIQRVAGNTNLWQVYDPSTGHSQYCTSEHEIRVWLDQRYSD